MNFKGRRCVREDIGEEIKNKKDLEVGDIVIGAFSRRYYEVRMGKVAKELYNLTEDEEAGYVESYSLNYYLKNKGKELENAEDL